MFLYKELSDKVVDAMYCVSNGVGPGLIESVYERALEIELGFRNIYVQRQREYEYYYRDNFVGVYRADLVVENRIIIELKAVQELNNIMESQLLNYMKISQIRVGYLANFKNPSLHYKRFVL